jgi:hypothetical protein
VGEHQAAFNSAQEPAGNYNPVIISGNDQPKQDKTIKPFVSE